MSKHIKLNKKEKQTILDLYNFGMSIPKIARQFGKANASIWYHIHKNNLKIHKMSHYCKYKDKKHDYFDNIDTEFKAYFLGLLWADGHNNIKKHTIGISLQEKDKEILEKLSIEIFGTIEPLKYNIRNNKDSKNRQNVWRLSITSKNMSDKLLEYGMTSNKSFTLTFPTCIPEHLICHFMRGYFDGDGSIYVTRNNKTYAISIISSPDFCKIYHKKIKDILGINLEWCPDNNYKKPMIYLKSNGNMKSFKFLSFLYQNFNICLERKYLKFLELKNWVDNGINIRKNKINFRNTKNKNYFY